MYDAEVETPRADAGIGLILRNKKGAGFEAIPAQVSGLCVRGNVKKVKQITLLGNPVFLFAKNNDPPEFWKLESGNQGIRESGNQGNRKSEIRESGIS